MTAAPVADLPPAEPADRPPPTPEASVTFSPSVLARARRWATFYPASEVLLDPHGHFAPQPRDQMSVSVHLYAVTRRHLDGVRPDERAVLARMWTLDQIAAAQDRAARHGPDALVQPGGHPVALVPAAPAALRMDDLLGRLG